MKEPIVYLLSKLLQRNEVRVNEEELEFQILSHPTYPSLHSVTGVLDHFAIKNYALEVPINAETIDLLPNCFLALTKGGTQSGYALANKQKNGIELTFNSKKTELLSTDIFLEVWTGVIVIIENEKHETAPKSRKINITKAALFVTITAMLAIFFFNGPTVFQSIHFLLSLVGVAICVLIVQHELGLHSKVLDKFCSEEHRKTSCNAVMNSKGATLFGFLKFSDVGIIYFIALALSWFFVVSSNTGNSIIVLVTLLAIPFTLYSIYYQYKVVRKWCPLCLSVVSVLWLQALSLYFTSLSTGNISFRSKGEAFTVFSFLATFALWQFIAPILKKEKELNTLKIEHYRFKRSFDIFKSLSNQSEAINTSINDNHEIVLGSTNYNAPLKVVVVTNPLCGFCKEAHELVENLLKTKPENIQVIIRFNVSADADSIDRNIGLRLIEIYNKAGKEACLLAMHDIYGNVSPNAWIKKWEEPSEKYAETLAKHKSWCKQNNLNFTPTILVNGLSFPKEYSRADLLYFVDDLIEEAAEKATPQHVELEVEA